MGKLGRPGNQNIPQHQQGSILARLAKLEKFQKDILRAMNQTFTIVDNRENATEEVVRALITLCGQEAVEKEVRRAKIEDLEGKSAKQKAGFDAAIEAGKVVPGDVVGDRSVILGSEVDGDGNQLYPVRVQLLFAQLPEDYQKCYKGAKVGETVTTPTKSKFTINEVWEVVVKGEEIESTQTTAAAPPADPAATVAAPTEGDEPPDAELEKQLVEELAADAESNA